MHPIGRTVCSTRNTVRPFLSLYGCTAYILTERAVIVAPAPPNIQEVPDFDDPNFDPDGAFLGELGGWRIEVSAHFMYLNHFQRKTHLTQKFGQQCLT